MRSTFAALTSPSRCSSNFFWFTIGASNLTHGGVVLGSPEYMSPEQARGEATLDARSDVWSFCVVLFESMTGVLPFTGQNYNAQLRAILEDTPKGLRDYATGDLELSMLVATGLAKDRDLRFRSMNELGTALARWLLAQGIYEDACGASIQSKWLDRASRTSIPDFSMPLSGVRPTEPRAPVFHTNDSGTDCEYEIPGWYSAEGDAGPSSTVTITLESCFIQEVTFPVERDDCDQIQTPPLQVVEVTFDGDDCPGG
jgi:serine/threonine protein kinase